MLLRTLIPLILVAFSSSDAEAFGGVLRRFLWRYPKADASRSEPLPVGPFPICPLKRYQDDPRESSPDFGPGLFFYLRSRQLKHPRIWKFLTGGKTPVVVVSGYDNSREMLGQEFAGIRGQATTFASKVVGTNSLRMTHDRKEHSSLRRLVGSGMAPAKVEKLLPALQETAEDIFLARGNETEWKMHHLCIEFTLDVAMKQIIGLRLEPGEISTSRQKLSDWFDGIFSQNMEKSLEAREYLVDKIQARINEIQQNQEESDGSALAEMVLAVDEENGGGCLTNDQIIDNTLLLILAGSETSSSTLTVCSLLLGLHPEKYSLLVQEQQRVLEKFGDELSRPILKKEMPYLDATIREALRMRPVVGGSMRGTEETVVVGGRQVPSGWLITYDRYLTHLLDPTTLLSDESHMDVRRGFRPERWLDDSTRPTTEFIPFGVGPRRCLGSDLAMTEMKVFLAVLTRNLEEFRMIHPALNRPFEWKQNCIVPVPEDGVVIYSSKSTKSK